MQANHQPDVEVEPQVKEILSPPRKIAKMKMMMKMKIARIWMIQIWKVWMIQTEKLWLLVRQWRQREVEVLVPEVVVLLVEEVLLLVVEVLQVMEQLLLLSLLQKIVRTKMMMI